MHLLNVILLDQCFLRGWVEGVIELANPLSYPSPDQRSKLVYQHRLPLECSTAHKDENRTFKIYEPNAVDGDSLQSSCTLPC